LVADQFRHDEFFEAAEVGVHHVQRHLGGSKSEPVLAGCCEHVKMDMRVLVSGEADEPEFAGLLGLDERGVGAVLGEGTIRIFVADYFVMLDEVDVVGLQTAEGFVELFGGFLFGSAVNFGHEEDLVAVTIAERLAEAGLTEAVVVVPGIVHEGYAAIDGGADDPEAERFVHLLESEVPSTQADGGDFLSGAAKLAVEHVGMFCEFHKVSLSDHPPPAGVCHVGGKSKGVVQRARRVRRGRRRKTLGSLTAGTVRRMVAADAFSWAAGKAGASSRAPNGGALFVNPYCYGTCSACGGGHGVPRPTRPNASDEVG